MANSGVPVQIPDDVLETIYKHARASFPYECCGWLIGSRESNSVLRVRPAENTQGEGTHPTEPDRTEETAFVISGRDHIELAFAVDADAPDTALVIYHSHPNGKAYFSKTDQKSARGEWEEPIPAWPVQHMVVGIDGERVVEARLFDWDPDLKQFTEVGTLQGRSI